MKRFSEQLHKKSETVKLTAAERRALRERVVSYMEYHPLPATAKKTTARSIVSPYQSETFIQVPFSYFAKRAAVLGLLILVVIPALAERSVPGDGLYAIKVRFNEEVRSSLAFTPYQKIEWETERLNRRIAEARLLASEGRLTEAVEAEVAAAVKTHSENAKREIETLRTADADEATLASIELTTTLALQAATLTEGTGEEEGTGQPTQLLATVVKEAAAADAVTNPDMPSYERLLGRVEINTTRARELLESLGLETASSDYQDINRRLRDIERTVGEAMQGREVDEMTARATLVDALQRTQRVIVFMTEIQASEAFDVDDFVPVILTPEEQTVERAAFAVAATEQIVRVESRLSSSTDPDIAEKVMFGIETLRDLEERMVLAGEFTEAKALHDELQTLAQDLLNILDVPANIPVPVSSEDEGDASETATSSESVVEDVTVSTERATSS